MPPQSKPLPKPRRRPQIPAIQDFEEKHVYGIQCGEFIKIGVTRSVRQRLNGMRLCNPHKLTVVYRRKMFAAFHCERKMHEILADKAVGREWFKATIEEVRAAGSAGFAYARQIYAAERARLDTRRDQDMVGLNLNSCNIKEISNN